jgi:hypothetical protein
MITIAAYLVLDMTVANWSGWLLVLPVLLDLAIIGSIAKDR